MSISRCISSHMTSYLLEWRNPQGREESWIYRHQEIETSWKHIGKVAIAEIEIGTLTIIAAIETIAYTAFTLISLTLYPISTKPYTFFSKLTESSAFTVLWGIFNATVGNAFYINVVTQEPFARYVADIINPTPFVFCRREDIAYLDDWQWHINTPPIPYERHVPQETINYGTDFIIKDILSDVDSDTLHLFQELNPSVYMFVLTKAIFIYVIGSKRNEEIPHFFKPETGRLITQLRQERYEENFVEQLRNTMRSYAQFDIGPQDEFAKTIFTRLRGAASKELQNSIFITRCWQRACDIFSSRSSTAA